VRPPGFKCALTADRATMMVCFCLRHNSTLGSAPVFPRKSLCRLLNCVPLERIALDDLLGGYKRRQRYHCQPLNDAPPCQIWSVYFLPFLRLASCKYIYYYFYVRRFVTRRRECHSFASDGNMNVRLISSDTSSMQGRIQGRIIRPYFHHSLGAITLGSALMIILHRGGLLHRGG
jgi:hypothetical protein